MADWLAARRPAPPPALAARVRAMLGSRQNTQGTAVWQECLSAAEHELARLLHGGCDHREMALDLLAIDALVTYAFEAAAEDPARLDARAGEAMTRIAALAAVR